MLDMPEHIQEHLGVASIGKKLRETHLRCPTLANNNIDKQKFFFLFFIYVGEWPFKENGQTKQYMDKSSKDRSGEVQFIRGRDGNGVDSGSGKGDSISYQIATCPFPNPPCPVTGFRF